MASGDARGQGRIPTTDLSKNASNAIGVTIDQADVPVGGPAGAFAPQNINGPGVFPAGPSVARSTS
jgi:hypothetical protein